MTPETRTKMDKAVAEEDWDTYFELFPSIGEATDLSIDDEIHQRRMDKLAEAEHEAFMREIDEDDD
jgi:hypothetical protein